MALAVELKTPDLIEDVDIEVWFENLGKGEISSLIYSSKGRPVPRKRNMTPYLTVIIFHQATVQEDGS